MQIERSLPEHLREPTRVRFEAQCCPEPNSGCWIWTGKSLTCGYGRFSLDGRSFRAHRASWLIYRGGRLLPEIFVCHGCDTPVCVNPDHLFLGDALTNVEDMNRKGRAVSLAGADRANAKLTDEQVRAILNDGRSYARIAEAFGVGITLVSGIKAGKRWRHVSGGESHSHSLPVGSANHKAKVTEAQVLEIRADIRSNKVIAAELGICRQQVLHIKQRKSWRHVG